MYSYLISQMRHFSFTKKGYDAPTGLKPWHVKEKASSGVPFSIDEALAIRDYYFSGENIDQLFREDNSCNALTEAEALQIIGHTKYYGEVMPELQDIIAQYIGEHVQSLAWNMGERALLALGLAVGRAAGVREERSRRKEETVNG